MGENMLFLTGLFPEEQREKIQSLSKGVIQYAADSLQWSIVRGLSLCKGYIKVVNLPYVGAYPYFYKSLYVGDCKFGDNCNIDGEGIRFFNFVGIKNFSRYINAKKALLSWVTRNEEDKVIIVYAIHTPFLKAVHDVKQRYPQIKVCLIVPDLPEFMVENSNYILSIFRKINQKILLKCYSSVDAYVLLTKYMVEKLPMNNKRWIVLEGIFNPNEVFLKVKKVVNDEIKTIFYSGTLAKRYGILNLLHAFLLIDNPNYRLAICGDGDARVEVEQASSLDSRILYMGQLPRNKVLELQENANLLVNPRTGDGEFTKYSFPSKTMEYLASGTPVLMYKLDGIPDEYYKYCFSIEETTVEALKMKIVDILNMDDNNLTLKGKMARQFIFDQKNPRTQCMKIVSLLNCLK